MNEVTRFSGTKLGMYHIGFADALESVIKEIENILHELDSRKLVKKREDIEEGIFEMKLSVYFKNGNEEVYDKAVIDWDKRVIEFFDEKGELEGFIPFEAILVVTKSII